jgi:hypothetical protein
MIATSHVIIGGAVGVAVGAVTKNPTAALAAGIVSHLICDAIPHLDSPFPMEYQNGEYDNPIWNKKLLFSASVDSLLAFAVILFLWVKYFGFNFWAPFAWGALGGYLPDLLDNFPLWSRQIRLLPGFKQFHAFHLAVHNLWRFRFPMPNYWLFGTITQIVFIVPSLWFIIH